MLISFDFDETLTQPTWNAKYGYFEPSDEPSLEVISKLKSYHSQGHSLRIVTTRWQSEEIEEFVKQHQLPVVGIHCTEGELKAEVLRSLGCKLHYDDNGAEAIANLESGIPTIIISHKFDPSTQKVYCCYAPQALG